MFVSTPQQIMFPRVFERHVCCFDRLLNSSEEARTNRFCSTTFAIQLLHGSFQMLTSFTENDKSDSTNKNGPTNFGLSVVRVKNRLISIH